MNFIIDTTTPDSIANELSGYGNIYKSANIKMISDATSSHPDLQIHFISDTEAFVPKSLYEFYREKLPEHITVYIGNSDIEFTYPMCCAYNIARVGNFVICNTKIADKNIMEYYSKNSYKIIHVNQGYAKCNICPIGENAFITEDCGIYNICKKITGLTVYKIEEGDVRLNGYDYGFIGGATGLLENKTLLCSGKLTKNKEKVDSILKQHDVRLITLSTDNAYDFGSILSFK